MMQPIVRNSLLVLFVGLLCAGTITLAQDDITARGIEAFRDTCLRPDVRSETIYQWAADKDLKIVQGQGPERAGGKQLTWEVARSGDATVLLQAYINSPGHLHCSVYFSEQRDSRKQVEAFFLEEMKRHPNAQQLQPGAGPGSTAYTFIDEKVLYGYFDGRKNDQDKPHIFLTAFGPLRPSNTTVPRSFATQERSYRLFVTACLARFPDIESIGEYAVHDLGWKSQSALQTQPYHNEWSLWDPFDEMGPYALELIRLNGFKSCALHFDLRAAVPMERLIRSFALVHADARYRNLPRKPNEQIEYYSGLIGGTQTLLSLRTDEAGRHGELRVFVETPH
ncbi:hypothetical protein CVM73_04695 [Bradyrhizobium forestalis]|uniref:Uncharacterized protein n=1 Tax=Bradyrhizobium forestalis TaxID=1419263 RepID=A0A2M8RE81_9BRAD|nr:hypothetical protein [Bradyrhizobium forestalis]PJG56120.1 hypothetical protein CVM73_04695 [Bradyrhizobium forestalis]